MVVVIPILNNPSQKKPLQRNGFFLPSFSKPSKILNFYFLFYMISIAIGCAI